MEEGKRPRQVRVTLQEQEEKRRQQLDSILEEQKAKWERKQQQTQNMSFVDTTGLSVFGKLMAYNQRLIA